MLRSALYNLVRVTTDLEEYISEEGFDTLYSYKYGVLPNRESVDGFLKMLMKVTRVLTNDYVSNLDYFVHQVLLDFFPFYDDVPFYHTKVSMITVDENLDMGTFRVMCGGWELLNSKEVRDIVSESLFGFDPESGEFSDVQVDAIKAYLKKGYEAGDSALHEIIIKDEEKYNAAIEALNKAQDSANYLLGLLDSRESEDYERVSAAIASIVTFLGNFQEKETVEDKITDTVKSTVVGMVADAVKDYIKTKLGLDAASKFLTKEDFDKFVRSNDFIQGEALNTALNERMKTLPTDIKDYVAQEMVSKLDEKMNSIKNSLESDIINKYVTRSDIQSAFNDLNKNLNEAVDKISSNAIQAAESAASAAATAAATAAGSEAAVAAVTSALSNAGSAATSAFTGALTGFISGLLGGGGGSGGGSGGTTVINNFATKDQLDGVLSKARDYADSEVSKFDQRLQSTVNDAKHYTDDHLTSLEQETSTALTTLTNKLNKHIYENYTTLFTKTKEALGDMANTLDDVGRRSGEQASHISKIFQVAIDHRKSIKGLANRMKIIETDVTNLLKCTRVFRPVRGYLADTDDEGEYDPRWLRGLRNQNNQLPVPGVPQGHIHVHGGNFVNGPNQGGGGQGGDQGGGGQAGNNIVVNDGDGANRVGLMSLAAAGANTDGGDGTVEPWMEDAWFEGKELDETYDEELNEMLVDFIEKDEEEDVEAAKSYESFELEAFIPEEAQVQAFQDVYYYSKQYIDEKAKVISDFLQSWNPTLLTKRNAEGDLDPPATKVFEALNDIYFFSKKYTDTAVNGITIVSGNGSNIDTTNFVTTSQFQGYSTDTTTLKNFISKDNDLSVMTSLSKGFGDLESKVKGYTDDTVKLYLTLAAFQPFSADLSKVKTFLYTGIDATKVTSALQLCTEQIKLIDPVLLPTAVPQLAKSLTDMESRVKLYTTDQIKAIDVTLLPAAVPQLVKNFTDLESKLKTYTTDQIKLIDPTLVPLINNAFIAYLASAKTYTDNQLALRQTSFKDGLVGWWDAGKSDFCLTSGVITNWRSRDEYGCIGGSLFQDSTTSAPGITGRTWANGVKYNALTFGPNSAKYMRAKNMIIDPATQNTNLCSFTCFVVWWPSTAPSASERGKLISSDAGANATKGYSRTFGFDNRYLATPTSVSVTTASTSSLCLYSRYGPLRFTDSSGQQPVITSQAYCTWFTYRMSPDISPSSAFAQYCSAWHMGINYLDNVKCDNTFGESTTTIGCSAGNSSDFYSGEIYELLFYNKSMSTSEMQATITYIKSKYGFTFNY